MPTPSGFLTPEEEAASFAAKQAAAEELERQERERERERQHQREMKQRRERERWERRPQYIRMKQQEQHVKQAVVDVFTEYASNYHDCSLEDLKFHDKVTYSVSAEEQWLPWSNTVTITMIFGAGPEPTVTGRDSGPYLRADPVEYIQIETDRYKRLLAALRRIPYVREVRVHNHWWEVIPWDGGW